MESVAFGHCITGQRMTWHPMLAVLTLRIKKSSGADCRQKPMNAALLTGFLVALTTQDPSLATYRGRGLTQPRAELRTIVVHRHSQHDRFKAQPGYLPRTGREPYRYISPFASIRQHHDYLRPYGGNALGVGRGRDYWSFDW